MVAARSPQPSLAERSKRHSLLQALHRRGTSSRLQLARELRLIRPDVPIALLSGYTEATDAEDFAHIRLRLQKPPRVEELGRTVEILLGRG